MEEPKKIYLITAGEYSDYCVLTVCSTREKAEHFCEVLNRNGGRYGDQAGIEEYPVDSIPIEDLDIPVWLVGFKGQPLYASDVRRCDRVGALDINKFNPYRIHEFSVSKGGSIYSVDIMAETEEDAIKKASDYLAKYRAEKEGL
jgi:hypothetical protein